MKPRRLHSATILSIVTTSSVVGVCGSLSSWCGRAGARRALLIARLRGDHRRRRCAGSLRWRAVARILIVGGGCPGRQLAALMIERGHAVRITTRSERGRSAIEQTGAECWIGTPDRLATMRGALDHVTIACWMLGRRARRGEGAGGASLLAPRVLPLAGDRHDRARLSLRRDAGGAVPAELPGRRRADRQADDRAERDSGRRAGERRLGRGERVDWPPRRAPSRALLGEDADRRPARCAAQVVAARGSISDR